MTIALGKGEVESSILSCSTIKPNEINAVSVSVSTGHRAEQGKNTGWHVARNWQTDSSGLHIAERAGYLYRYWSDRGLLLYIGISINAVARLGQHRNKDWFPRIAKITVERFDTYAEAQLAELHAICYEGPIHNIAGPRDAKDLGPAMARLRAAQRRASAKATSNQGRTWDAFQADLAFGTIPAGTPFAAYRSKLEAKHA